MGNSKKKRHAQKLRHKALEEEQAQEKVLGEEEDNEEDEDAEESRFAAKSTEDWGKDRNALINKRLPVKTDDGGLMPAEKWGRESDEEDDENDPARVHLSLVYKPGERREDEEPDRKPKKKGKTKRGETDDDDNEAEENGVNGKATKSKEGQDQQAPVLNAAGLLLLREEKKVEIAKLSEQIIGDPEAGVSASSEHGRAPLRKLIKLVEEDQDKMVQKLAILSLLAVFRDILPEYRIRQLSDKELAMKVSKDVRKVRKFEKNLLECYQTFLKVCHRLISSSLTECLNIDRINHKDQPHMDRPKGSSLAVVSLRALCTILVARPDFNFRENLFATIIPHLNSPIDEVRKHCVGCIKTLLRDDKTGDATLEVVVYISKLVRAHNHGLKGTVHPDVINVLLQCDLKADMKDTFREEQLKAQKKAKKKRKRGKADNIADVLQEASTEADPYQKHGRNVEALRELFTMYLRVLKKAPSSFVMPAVLRGVARYVHLINMEIAQALVSALTGLIHSNILDIESGLQCIHTVTLTLRGPGVELNIDESDYVAFLFQLLVKSVASLELRERDRMVPQVIRCIEAIFIGRKLYQHSRVAPIVVRLTILANHVSPHACLALLSIIRQLMLRYPAATRSLFDTEQEGDVGGAALGLPPADDSLDAAAMTQDCNVLWPLTQLRFHYHPYVREFVEKAFEQAPLLPVDRPYGLFDSYNPYLGGFNPPIKKTLQLKAFNPKKFSSKKKKT